MVIKIFPTEKFPATMCTRHWDVVAHRPVADHDVIIIGLEGITVLTMIWPHATVINLVHCDVQSLKRLRTVGAWDLDVLASALWLKGMDVDVEMISKLS